MPRKIAFMGRNKKYFCRMGVMKKMYKAGKQCHRGRSATLQLRDGSDYDAATLAAVFTDAVHALTTDCYDSAQRAAWAPRPPDAAFWRERLRPLHVIVAIQSGACAGFIGYDGGGHIDLLFTAPAHAHQGVASRLYAQAQKHLRHVGVQRVSTRASLAARPFFERQGFGLECARQVSTRGILLRCFDMYKQLE